MAVTPIKNWDTIVQDGKLSRDEWQQISEKLDPNKEYEIEIDGQTYTGKLADIENKLNSAGVFAQSADADDPATDTAKKAQTELDGVKSEMDKLLESIKQDKANSLDTTAKEKQLAELIKQATALMAKGAKRFNMAKYNKAAGMPEGGKTPMSGKAQITTGGGQQTAGGSAQAQTTSGTAGGGFTGPANWGAQTFSGGVPAFNSDTYMKTMAMTDNIMSSWDSVNKNTSRGKQLMMLFFYFAKMAESGSMDSMYQFMKFITYIISKDKAKQQIEMGKKLIQLQELSRSWTNKLMNCETSSSDASASNELMKTMTIVKSETDAIATSQKLISQMMEEFAQVVETLTNTTKAALETAGRIKRTVSTMR